MTLPGGVIPATIGGLRDPDRFKECLFMPAEEYELQSHVLLISYQRVWARIQRSFIRIRNIVLPAIGRKRNGAGTSF